MKDWNSINLKIYDHVQYKLKTAAFIHIGTIVEINQKQSYVIISDNGIKDKIYLRDCIFLNRISF